MFASIRRVAAVVLAQHPYPARLVMLNHNQSGVCHFAEMKVHGGGTDTARGGKLADGRWRAVLVDVGADGAQDTLMRSGRLFHRNYSDKTFIPA